MKRLFLLFVCLQLVIAASLSVYAVSPKIVDNADLLTEAETSSLEEKAQQLSDRYDMDIVIVTVYSLNGKSSEAYADDFYDENGYGIGEDDSGVLLLLSMEYRDWAISTCGETIYALTDYGVQSVFEEISWYLAEDEYYLAFSEYLDALEPYFDAYQNGEPMDGYAGDYDGPGTYLPGTQEEIVYYDEPSGFTVQKFLIALVIGIVAAAMALLIMRSRMNTARAQHGAMSYMRAGSYSVNQQRDMFLYSRVHKVRRAENNTGGGHRGGGSSIHRSSGGSRHGGGHGKF